MTLFLTSVEEGTAKCSQWWDKAEAAAQRVMGKIEEVEGIIRRVRDWTKDGSDSE